ncbi:serine/threonine protein phosphatase [Actinomyces faecalis]|uniref:serine/threonine protein phosphatase n=1 Tax=Actinomyces faecalis TaxID=2722820 RepID=UPI001F2279C8|nr:serine/threonine protein phosphatase [Actinomyces faecalis]
MLRDDVGPGPAQPAQPSGGAGQAPGTRTRRVRRALPLPLTRLHAAWSRWWSARSVAFRKVTRTLVLLVVTAAVSLAVGLVTASASSPIGPHTARWSTTLDSQVTVDLGPLGQASLDSPAGLVGVEVVLGEIPAESTRVQIDSSTLGRTLSTDASSYVSLVSHPDLTVKAGLRALLADGVRRAGLVASLMLCLVAVGRLATSGRLRDSLLATMRHGMATGLAAVTALGTVAALLVPALGTHTSVGTTLSVLAGTPLEGARLSGRLADVVQAYGPRVREVIDDNEAFYAKAGANMAAAWQASQEVDGLVAVTVSEGRADVEALRAEADAVVAKQLADLPASEGADAADGNDGEQDPVATSQAEEPASQESLTAAPEDQEGEGHQEPEGAATTVPAQAPAATGALAVRERTVTTAVLSTDLHCNLDMIALVGQLDGLAGAQVHMDDGDLTMTGSNPEQLCVDALTSAVPRGTARVATIGNHDSNETGDQLRSRGWTVTDGTVQEVAGLRLLGDVDANRTPAGRSFQRGEETSEQVGARLAEVSCEPGADVDLVLIHQPYTFSPLVSSGCAPLLVAGHSHQEYGMSVSEGTRGPVAQLRAGAGLGGTSVGRIKSDAYLHVLSFDEEGHLLGWRAVTVHTDASVTVGAWNEVPQTGTSWQGASQAALKVLAED